MRALRVRSSCDASVRHARSVLRTASRPGLDVGWWQASHSRSHSRQGGRVMNDHAPATRLATPAVFGTTGLSSWIQANVSTIILLLSAATALWAGKNGNISKVVTIAVCAIIGVAVLALATSGAATDIGAWLVSLFRA